MSKWATKREGKDDAGGGKSGLSKSLNLSLLKKPSSGAAKSTVDAYKWDLSSPAVSRMPKSPEERRRRAKYMADEGKKAGEKEDRSGGSLEPKVFVPYVTRPGHTPRRVAVERKRQFYASQDLTRILQDHGVTSETMVQTGLDENVPMQDLNNILPLTLFDDETYEQYQPTEWIMLGAGNVPAKTMFAGEWVACTVKSYDEATSLFQIEINGAQDNRTRLEICFDVEDPFQFAKRLAAASAGRKLAEGLIRYNLYVDCMPTDDVADLDSEQVNRIVKIALHSRALQQSENDTSQLLNEIHMDYARTMNKIVFDANLKGGSEATMMGDLQLPEQLPANPPPQFGCLQLPESNFSQKFSSFAFSSFLTKEEVIDALQGVQQECNAIKKVKFFNTTNRKSLNLEEFQVAQSQALKISGRKIKEDWTSGVVSHIRTSLQSCGKGHFNIYESKNDVYKHSKLKKLMQRVNFLMQSSLQNVVRDSVKLYGDFIKLAMDAEVKLIDIKTAVNDFIRDSTLSSDAWDVANTLEGLKRPPALFFLEVQPTAEPICLNQAEVDEAAAAIKAWKPPKDDKNAKCPIQRVAAEMGRIFEYTTPLESYGKVIMVALDNVLNEMGKIEQTEKLLMDRLFWSSTPTLQSISPNEDEIVNLRNEIQAKIDECLKHPIAYLKFLNHKKDYRKSEYIKFLNIDEAAIMEKITPETPEDIDLAACKKVIDYHTLQANKYKDKLPDFAVRLGMFTCNLASIRTTLVKKHLNIAAQATALIAKCNKSNGASIVKKYEQIRKRLQQIPTDVEDVASMNEFIEGISAEMNQFGPNLVAINEACRILDGYGVKDAEQFSMKWKIIGWPKKIFIQVESTEQVQSEKKMEYAAEMEDEQVIFEQTLISLEQECAQFQGYSDVGRVQMVAKHVKSLDEKLKKAEEDARTFNSREILFGREPTEYTKVNEIRKEFTPYQGLWSNVSDWLQFHEGCMTGPFDEVDGINLEDVVDRYSKGINKAYKTFEKAGNKACMDVQFSVLDLLAGFINYGGRVTDDKDLRTIEVIMRQFYNPKILTDDYKFSESGLYYSFKFDPDDAYNSYVEYIRSLPINPEPEAFGMHDNANITCDQNELYTMLKTIVSLGGAGGGGGGSSREEMTIAAAAEMADKLPEVMDEEATAMAFPVDYNESMNTLLCQEQVKFNNLLRVMKHTLFNVQRALKGLLVMSSDLETVANAIFTQDIPVVWESVGYPSLMPLTPWFLDLLKRVEFMEKWIEFGTPKAFWISGFFFPQAFLTGTLQNFARKYQKPIDTIDFDFKFRDEKKTDASDITERAPDGAYVYGLFIQGARWNYETHVLDDPRPKELYDQCPVMHLDPVQDREDTMSGIYRCPVYKTLTRAGMLSTTGHSTNFVCWFEFPCEGEVEWRKTLCSETNAQRLYADSAKWIKAGVACFCALAF